MNNNEDFVKLWRIKSDLEKGHQNLAHILESLDRGLGSLNNSVVTQSKKRKLDNETETDDDDDDDEVESSRFMSEAQAPIKLNVGGKVFETTITTLVSHTNSYFGVMFSGRWNIRPQADGSIFIDRTPLVFEHVLNYLRTSKLDLEHLSEKEISMLIDEAKFYQLDELIELVKSLKFDTKILNENEIEQLSRLFPGKKYFKLLYRGTRDGFSAEKFHRLCDYINETVVVIRDTHGCTFGGYAPLCWETHHYRKSKDHERTFLFHYLNEKIIRLDQTASSSRSMLSDKDSIVIFGGNSMLYHDLYIASECNSNTDSFSIQTHFQTPITESRSLCSHGKNFQVTEIEVFEVK